MKKLFLAAAFGLLGFAVNAQPVNVNNAMPPSPCATITVQFVALDAACNPIQYSKVITMPSGASVYDMRDPAVWAPAAPPPPYPTSQFAALVCATCPGLPAVCLPLVGVPCFPPHQGPLPLRCCPGDLQADWPAATPPWQLTIHS